jgi:sugar phosphate isomerase/epimerase
MSERLRAPHAVLSYLTVSGASPEETVAAAASAGFGAATLRVVKAGGGYALDAAALAAIVARSRDEGVSIADVEYVDLHPSFEIAEADAILDASARVGATYVTTSCSDPVEARAVERLAALGAAAAERDLCVGFEFSAYGAVTSLSQACRMAAEAGAENVVVVVDSLHLARTGGSPDDVALAVSEDAERFPCLHLADASLVPAGDTQEALATESREDRLLPGEGELPLSALVDAAPRATLYVEAPVRSLSHLPYAERARRAAAALESLAATVRLG